MFGLSFASSASCRPLLPRWFAFHSRISVVCPWSPTATSTTSPNRAQSLGFFRSVFPPPLIPKMPWKLRIYITKYDIYTYIHREREIYISINKYVFTDIFYIYTYIIPIISFDTMPKLISLPSWIPPLRWEVWWSCIAKMASRTMSSFDTLD